MRTVIPLKKRPLDIVITAFFLINILFITYIVDFEQIAVSGPVRLKPPNFEYPACRLWCKQSLSACLSGSTLV